MKLKTIFAAASVAAATAFAAMGAQASDLVVNGGFDTGDFTGWTQNGFAVVTAYGGVTGINGYYAETGCTQPGCYISQDVSTVAGQDYTLSLDFNPGQNVQFGGAYALVQWNGVTLEDIGVGSNAWTTHTYTVHATGTTSNFTLQALQQPAWDGVDNISITGAPGAGGVPEPASWALMIGGFGMAGAALRRRQRAVAA